MKIFFLLFVVTIMAVSCGDKSTNGDVSGNKPDTTKMDYAYTVDHPDNWEWGSKENTKSVLAALKAYEQGNINESVKYFGDSVKLSFDNFEKTVSKDSLIAMFTSTRNDLKNVQVIMQDFESVKSKDDKEEYVSLWYKEIQEDKQGKTDSMEIMDDMKMKDGKIISLNEKTRKLGPGKV